MRYKCSVGEYWGTQGEWGHGQGALHWRNVVTLDEVKAWVAKIDAGKDDDGCAHCDEDDLHKAFIRHVAEVGDPALKEMATEVLKTGDISFARWYE